MADEENKKNGFLFEECSIFSPMLTWLASFIEYGAMKFEHM